MHTVLVCDDEKDIVSALQIYLKTDGYEVLTASCGQEALDLLERQPVQLVLMDVMMPGMDGIETMAKLREKWNLPVILLTAKSEDEDKIRGLNGGADDYITKPFQPGEVLARVRSQIRRYTQLGACPSKEEDGLLRVGAVELCDRSKQVTVDGNLVQLTATEYEILKLLMMHPGQVFSTGEIYRNVWKNTPLGAENTVAVHICHLREKIEINPQEPRYLKVVWARGYKIEG